VNIRDRETLPKKAIAIYGGKVKPTKKPTGIKVEFDNFGK